MTPTLAQLGLPDWAGANLQSILAGLIVVVGLFLYGIKDVARWSLTRAWALAYVSFRESIRRRVLLITPLACLGIVIVSQIQKPVDEADAIRQTIKVAMFATGMVVALVTIILACTNLPKEIDNRVIYTVVTKPTTRLEIVFGKTMGFACVSATILLIMGLFTWGYLEFREWELVGNVAKRLEVQGPGEVPAIHRDTLTHYRDKGLLSAKRFSNPQSLQIYSRLPDGDVRWVFGSSEQDILVPFALKAEDFVGADRNATMEGGPGAAILAHIRTEQRRLTASEKQDAGAGDPLAGIPSVTPEEGAGPVNPEFKASGSDAPAPRVSIQILDRGQNTLIAASELNGGKSLDVPPPGVDRPIEVQLSPDQVKKVLQAGNIFVQILPLTVATQYGLSVPDKPENSPVVIAVPTTQGLAPIFPFSGGGDKSLIAFRGRQGSFGQQLKGGAPASTPVGVYAFRNATVNPDASGNVQFELRSGVERSGDEVSEQDDMTDVQVQILDASYKPVGDPILVHPESLRTAYFDVPAKLLPSGGDFAVAIKSLTGGHWVGLRPDSLNLVVATNSFAFNVAKSLFILWLLSVLVVTISIFASTFLSWPIAIVLTVVILLGRWGVLQLGDANSSGIGNQVATDFGFTNAAQAKVVSTTVEGLSKALNTVANFLPDITRFEATEDVERGITLSYGRVTEALMVTLSFGLPLLVLSYVFLKNKEVAP